MDTIHASHSGTTSLLSDVVRSGMRTTTWRQELPGVWVATHNGAVVGALQCMILRDDTAADVPFGNLDEARQTAHRQLRTTMDAPEPGPIRTGAAEQLRGFVTVVGAVLARALAPQLHV
jgi:hypothetical protein